jgi:hypothetical protein
VSDVERTRIMNLNQEEIESLKCARTDESRRVRMVYFAMKRCNRCEPKDYLFNSCYKHMVEIAYSQVS